METKKENYFAIIGCGFISDRHIQAIEDIGGKILITCDIDERKKHKVKGASFYTDYRYITNDENWDKITHVTICTPNYLHFRMALLFSILGKEVIVEKPTVIKVSDLEELKQYEDKIHCILQLRHNQELIDFRNKLSPERHQAEFAVCVHRDDWYFNSWKNNKEQSGGLAFNIGAHYFDLLTWFFGDILDGAITHHTDREVEGWVKLQNADAKFKLTINQPMDNQFRYFRVDGEEVNLNKHFETLHTKLYEEMLKGNSIKIKDVEPSIKLIAKLYDDLH